MYATTSHQAKTLPQNSHSSLPSVDQDRHQPFQPAPGLPSSDQVWDKSERGEHLVHWVPPTPAAYESQERTFAVSHGDHLPDETEDCDISLESLMPDRSFHRLQKA